MIFNNQILKGKIALISGGATGICYGISKQFLKHGAGVYIISRKIDNINKAIKSLKEETGNNNVWGSSCDVRDEKMIQKTVQNIIKEIGHIDILVNGAAGNFLAPFQSLSPNAFRTVLMIDTVGTFLLSKYVNQYAFQKGGVIINITANLHYNGTALQTHAGTAKAGVDALTKHMAVQLGPKGVRVVGICPGVIVGTQGFDRLSAGLESESLKSLVPLQNYGVAKDIANSAVFLASQGASYITGITLIVDGGVTLTYPNFTFLSPQFVKSYPRSKI